MYSYSGRGWKPTTPSNSSSSSSRPSAGQPSSVTSGDDRCCSKTIAEDDDEVDLLVISEEKDVAAPLPATTTTGGVGVGGTTKGQMKQMKNTSAKDKRRLREKRRSTGVASLAGHEVDEETGRNTSFNETSVVAMTIAASAAATPDAHLDHHHLPQLNDSQSTDDAMTTQSQQPIPSHNGAHHQSKPAADQTNFQSLRIHDDDALVSTSASRTSVTESHPIPAAAAATSSVYTRNLCARPFEAKRSILKGGGGGGGGCARPLIPAKPEVAFVGTSTGGSSRSRLSSNEESVISARVTELEKLLECEKRENAVMKQFLSEKDSKIRDLELHVATLNEDLDLADEDYLRLEEENRALGRALSQLNTSE